MTTEGDTFFLAQTVCEEMLKRLEWMVLQPKQILLLGEALDQGEILLAERYSEAQIIRHEGIIALSDQSVDLLFANLLLPRVDDLSSVLERWKHLLRPNGLMVFSSFGPDTLIELREHAPDSISIHMEDMHNLGDHLVRARFVDPVLDVDQLQITYRELSVLQQELQMANLITKQELSFPANSDQLFSLTFEIVYGHAWGPEKGAEFTADTDGTVKIPLSHLRKSIV